MTTFMIHAIHIVNGLFMSNMQIMTAMAMAILEDREEGRLEEKQAEDQKDQKDIVASSCVTTSSA
jgi:hypothetical protein